MNPLMSKADCPGCGASIEFKSTSSIISVCPYCHTTVSKSSDSLQKFSKKSEILKDFSKLKIGTTGVFLSNPFSVIGRIQVQYSTGFWNEWFISLSNGETGWISEHQDTFVITINPDTKAQIPEKIQQISVNKSGIPNEATSFDELRINTFYKFGNLELLCTDITQAQIIGAEGEIDFDIINNSTIKAADFKNKNAHITIDYSEPDPIVYQGFIFKEKELSFNNIKTIEELNNDTNSKYGKVTNFSCPSCGATNIKIDGFLQKITCTHCTSELNVSQQDVSIITQRDALEQQTSTLVCGDKGKLPGGTYEVVGVVLKQEDDGGDFWVEYLLYEQNSIGNFIWLIEDLSTDDWHISAQIQTPLEFLPNGKIKHGKNTFVHQNYSLYKGVVRLVFGGFPWEISVGDETLIEEFSGKEVGIQYEINSEIERTSNSIGSHQEVSFTRTKPIDQEFILKAFKKQKPETKFVKQGDKELSFYDYAGWLISIYTIFILFISGNLSSMILWIVSGVLIFTALLSAKYIEQAIPAINPPSHPILYLVLFAYRSMFVIPLILLLSFIILTHKPSVHTNSFGSSWGGSSGWSGSGSYSGGSHK